MEQGVIVARRGASIVSDEKLPHWWSIGLGRVPVSNTYTKEQFMAEQQRLLIEFLKHSRPSFFADVKKEKK